MSDDQLRDNTDDKDDVEGHVLDQADQAEHRDQKKEAPDFEGHMHDQADHHEQAD